MPNVGSHIGILAHVGPAFIHCGESKTQRKCFLDEKRDGLVDENRINNQQNESNRRFIHQKSRFVGLICFKQ